MNILAGDYEIHASGIVHSFADEAIDFVLNESPEMRFRVRVERDDSKESRINGGTIDDRTYELVFLNPKDISFGPATPIRIGTMKGRSLYTRIRIDNFKNPSSYQICYSFYLGEVQNEK